jgi:hypothetical protein
MSMAYFLYPHAATLTAAQSREITDVWRGILREPGLRRPSAVAKSVAGGRAERCGYGPP